MIGRVLKNHQTIREQIRGISKIPFAGEIFTPERQDGPLKLHEYVSNLHDELGPIYKGQLGPVRAIFTNSPHHYGEIFRLEGKTPKHFLPECWLLYNQMRKRQRGLLFMDGEEWWNYRRILNKLLLGPENETKMKISDQAAEELIKSWKYQQLIVTNLEKQLYSWSLTVILGNLIGFRWTSYESQLTKEKDFLSSNLSKVFQLTSKLSTVSATRAKEQGLPDWLEFVKIVDECFDNVKALILKIKNLQTVDDGLLKSMINEGIQNDDDLSRIITDLIFASGDTTATTISWTLYLLSCNPEVQEQVYNTNDTIKRLSLIKGIIRETLRLYPVAPFLTRYLAEDSIVDGYRIFKDELIILSLCSSGRDVNNFPRPNEFLPQRWSRTSTGHHWEVNNPQASIPFALGRRSCVGKKMAETQMIALLNKLINTFKIDCLNKSRIKMTLQLITVPSEPLKLKLTHR